MFQGILAKRNNHKSYLIKFSRLRGNTAANKPTKKNACLMQPTREGRRRNLDLVHLPHDFAQYSIIFTYIFQLRAKSLVSKLDRRPIFWLGGRREIRLGGILLLLGKYL
jgi:hypothetical protein